MSLMTELEKQIISNFNGKEFDCNRKFLINKIDYNSFITANVILMLESSDIILPETKAVINKAKKHLQSYKKDELFYHWPIVNGKSKIKNSFLKQFTTLCLDPDADCSSIAQLALNEPNQKLVNCLEYFQSEKNGFVKFDYQKDIYSLKNILLTWFPQNENKLKPEQIDFVVIIHILLFLKKFDINNPNILRHEQLIVELLESKQILNKPFLLAPYYPSLFLITLFLFRYSLLTNSEYKFKPLIYSLSNHKKHNKTEQLILDLILLDNESKKEKINKLLNKKTKFPAVYHAPLFSFINKKNTVLHKPYFHIKFYSKSFYLAFFHLLIAKN